MALELPPLPYAYDFLQPYMSKDALEFHHDKHHIAYVDKGNELLKGSGLEGKSLEVAMISAWQDTKTGLFNQLGQHFNHSQFWLCLKAQGGGKKLPGKLEKKITSDLGGYDTFRGKFIEAGLTQFGSGWCWLALDNKTGKLEILKTPNAENPVVLGKTALLVGDVWEHSYYI